jgi:hypothetical protein
MMPQGEDRSLKESVDDSVQAVKLDGPFIPRLKTGAFWPFL